MIKVWARVVVTETSSRKNWQELVTDQTGGAQKKGVMMTQSQKAARFGVNSPDGKSFRLCFGPLTA